jgi:hypothetical protein
MEITKQISVFFENKPGRLANVLSALARDKVNLLALSVMDSHEHSVLRLVPDSVAKTRQVMKALSIPFTETDVMVLELRHQPGALAHICESLAAEHVNIDYAYCSAGGRNGKTLGVFKVANAEKSMRILNNSPNSSARRRMGRRPIHTRQANAPST